MNFKFYLFSVLVFVIFITGGLFTGAKIIYDVLFPMATNNYGEEVLAFIPFLIVSSLGGSFIGFLVSLIVIHKLGKKWGPQLNSGQHPVLKITFLSFLTFLALLFFFVIGYGYFKLEIQGK